MRQVGIELSVNLVKLHGSCMVVNGMDCWCCRWCELVLRHSMDVWCRSCDFGQRCLYARAGLSRGEAAGIVVYRSVFLNRRATARYRAVASIIPGRERFSWNLSF